MMEPEYKTIKQRKQAQTVVKKSRFISYAGSVEDEGSAVIFINEIKEKHKDASHNTYAYVIGKGTRTERYSDDKEPGGTAGIPILEKIRHYGLTDTVIVVTRYFGGTLLGTGGLARAYAKSADEAILTCGVIGFIKGYLVSIETDYHFLGKIQNYIKESGYRVIDEKYTDHVIINTLIPAGELERAKEHIADMTGAGAAVTVMTEQYIETEI